MRILHAVRSDGFAGVERHVARLARAQSAAGHQVAVVGGDPAGMRATVADPAVPLRAAATTGQVVALLRHHGPSADVVHVHMTAAEAAAALAARTVRGFPPVVSTRHFARRRGHGTRGAVVAALASSVVREQIAISRYVAEHVDGPSTVVPVGVETRPDGLAAREREPVVLLVQRLEPEKRTDVALDAFARSGLAAAGWRLDVAGDGSQRPALGAQADRLGIGETTRFLGARDDVEALLDRAGLLVATCPVEGLGLSVLEAMASGLPVVAAAAGGHLETLDGVDPLALFAPGDATAAAHALAVLAGDPDRRDACAAAGRDAQRARYTPAAQVAGTDAVYARVVA
ncbi:glycosyltransferase family 4 protein [Cellulosimicrobium sp. NPDC057127]|uniref:glycosyltransferase family 4 protein n=1 Tax=Cellulosimicrobium sp. NPDC057127 TaxID=3346026 RepID=UPI00362E1796